MGQTSIAIAAGGATMGDYAQVLVGRGRVRYVPTRIVHEYRSPVSPHTVCPFWALNYSASSVPVLQLGLSSESLPESKLNDLAINFVRPQLVTVRGVVVPYPCGGKMREVLINLDPALLQQKKLSPGDVLSAPSRQNLVLPKGAAKISEFEYDIRVNGSPETPPEDVGPHDPARMARAKPAALRQFWPKGNCPA